MLKLKLQFHSAPGHTSAIREDTFKNLQLNAGILLKNCDYSGIANAGALKTAIANAISGSSGALGNLPHDVFSYSKSTARTERHLRRLRRSFSKP